MKLGVWHGLKKLRVAVNVAEEWIDWAAKLYLGPALDRPPHGDVRTKKFSLPSSTSSAIMR